MEFILSRKDFEVYSEALHKWGVQADTYDFLALILPLPFYRMAEPLQGEALLSKEQVQEIIAHCNTYMQKIK